MAACEYCWSRASMTSNPSADYQRRLSESDCTPEMQAGPDAGWCPECRMMSMHQYAHVCMNKDCPSQKKKAEAQP